MLNFKQFILIGCLGLASFVAAVVVGQELGSGDDPRTALAVRQRLIERKMTELENKLTVIAERLKEKEPERAARMVAAYQASKERLITRRMAEVSQKLDGNQFGEAGQILDEVIRSLEALLKILVDREEPELSKQQEIQMLERWKDNIQERLREQQQQRRETENVSKKDQAIAKLQQQIEQLEGLIKKQQEVIEATEKNASAGLRTLDRIADQQFEVRQQTEKLATELGEDDLSPSDSKTEGAAEGGTAAQEAGAASDQTGDAQGEQKGDGTGEQKGDSSLDADKREQGESGQGKKEGQGSEGQSDSSAKTQSGDSQSPPGESGGESQSPPGGSSGQPGQMPPQPPQASQPQPPQPGQQPLEKAVEHQQSAEERLGSGKPQDAAQQSQAALEAMQQALNELEKEQRRIESLPPDALELLADPQRRTRDKALELLEEMNDAPQSADSPSGGDEGGEDGQEGAQPGQQSMEQAAESMQQAADNLQQQDGQQAEQQQRKAAEKMQEALDEIEERLNQLRDETRQEKLARLEARFQEMLDRQVVASVMTVELNDRQRQLGELRRRDRLTLLQLANEEMEIRELGQQAYDLLLEDGSSIVFPEIVQEIREDLEKVSQLLQQERTDQLPQLVQKEIEITIQDLLDALKEAQKNPSEGGGGGGGGGGEQPLLKKSAELKILRMHQMRLNRRAIQIDRIRGQDQQLDPALEQEASQAAEIQQRLIQMLEELLEKEDR